MRMDEKLSSIRDDLMNAANTINMAVETFQNDFSVETDKIQLMASIGIGQALIAATEAIALTAEVVNEILALSAEILAKAENREPPALDFFPAETKRNRENEDIRIEVLRSGFTYKEIAAEMNISQTWLSQALTRKVTPEMRQRISDAINGLMAKTDRREQDE